MMQKSDNRFGAILADPPWPFAVWSAAGNDRGATRHYPTMDISSIAALPIADMAAADCALFLWVTRPILPAAIDVGRCWGFTYKTVAFTWAKTTRVSGAWHMGLGYWTRANPEDCLLFTRGKPKRLAKNVRQLIVAPVREHSRKPDEVYERIERLIAGPYLELFARQRRHGWSVWGNETEKFNDRHALDRP